MSGDAGAHWAPGWIAAPDAGEGDCASVDVTARSGLGTAAVHNQLVSVPHPSFFRRRAGYEPTFWEDPVAFNDFDVEVDLPTTINWLGPAHHGLVYLRGGSRIPYFDRISLALVFADDFETGDTSAWTGPHQGCSRGYWRNHPGSWQPTGYAPDQTVESVFVEAAAYPGLGSATLLQALDFGGGSDLSGAARLLLREAVAAVLNAAHPDVNYPRTEAEVIGTVDAALATADIGTLLSLSGGLRADNNSRDCPL